MDVKQLRIEGGTKKPHPECERIWRTFVEDLGGEPQHNAFVGMATRHGVSRTKAREDFQLLKRGTASNGTSLAQGETMSDESVTYEVQDTISAAMGRRLEALEGQVQQLRDLVMQLSPRSPRQPQDMSEFPSQLGKLVARLASQDKAMQTLEAQLHTVTSSLATLDEETRPLRQWWRLLCADEDAWNAWLSMLRSSGNWTKKTLLRFFVEATGRELAVNDKVLQ